jgi:hypothetical protein
VARSAWGLKSRVLLEKVTGVMILTQNPKTKPVGS